jgi:hypothetical protein
MKTMREKLSKYPGPTDEQIWDSKQDQNWDNEVNDYVIGLEQKMNRAMYNTFTEYLRYVFQDVTHPTKAKFVDDVIERYKDRFRQKAIVFALSRETIF